MESFNLDTAAKATEHFDFGSTSPDLKPDSKRNVRNEITNKGFDPEVVIDAFEQSKGIKKRSRVETTELEFKNIILDPEQQRDQDRLNELLNNKKYVIALWKDTWTPQGNFRVFIVYGAKKEQQNKEK